MLTKIWAAALMAATYIFFSNQAIAKIIPVEVWDGLEIKADAEAPNQLAVVLWDKAKPISDIPKLVSELMDENLDPVATADFLRAVEAYRQTDGYRSRVQ